MKTTQIFNALHGSNVSRNEIENLIEQAKAENNTNVIYRLSNLLNNSPKIKKFEDLQVIKYKTALNKPVHTGIYSEALDDCGRLKKGFKFANGTIVRVLPKVKKTTAKTPKKYAQTPAKPEPKFKVGDIVYYEEENIIDKIKSIVIKANIDTQAKQGYAYKLPKLGNEYSASESKLQLATKAQIDSLKIKKEAQTPAKPAKKKLTLDEILKDDLIAGEIERQDAELKKVGWTRKDIQGVADFVTKKTNKTKTPKLKYGKKQQDTNTEKQDNSKTPVDLLRIIENGLQIAGITRIDFDDNFKSLIYGTKTSGTIISVQGKEIDVKSEYDFEKKNFNKEKNINFDIEIKETLQSRLSNSEKIEIVKMLNQRKKHLPVIEKIILPFYQYHLGDDLKIKKEAQTPTKTVNKVTKIAKRKAIKNEDITPGKTFLLINNETITIEKLVTKKNNQKWVYYFRINPKSIIKRDHVRLAYHDKIVKLRLFLNKYEAIEIEKPTPPKSTPPKTTTTKSDVVNIEMSKIFTDEKRFQNRTKLNESVVKNIVENYDSTQFDPIILWYDIKAKKYYVLAGHHRFEALKQLGKKTAPVKIADYTEDKAIQYAKVESNANRSLELPQERAKIYRDLRKKGTAKATILSEAKKLEGKNASYIVNLSYLKPNGITLSALDQLSETTDKQNATIIEKMADWIGEARRNNDKITDAHEKEMFDFLQDKEASKRINTKVEFLQKISAITTDLYFYENEPLNLKRFKYQSEGEQAYDKEYADLKANVDRIIANRLNILDRIKNPLNNDYIKPTDKDYRTILKALDQLIAKYDNDLIAAQKKLVDLTRKKGYYTNAGSNQAGLFGVKKNMLIINTRYVSFHDNFYTIGYNKNKVEKGIEDLKISGNNNSYNSINIYYDKINKTKKQLQKILSDYTVLNSKTNQVGLFGVKKQFGNKNSRDIFIRNLGLFYDLSKKTDFDNSSIKIYEDLEKETFGNWTSPDIYLALRKFDKSKFIKYCIDTRFKKPLKANIIFPNNINYKSEFELKDELKNAKRLNAPKKKVNLAPNGKPSNLTDAQYKQVRTAAFKKWFGDWEKSPKTASKVIDENGEPLVVYHGSRNESYFDTFNPEKGNPVSMGGLYFSNLKDFSKKFSGTKGFIYEVFLNIKNPNTGGFDISGATMTPSVYRDGGIFTKTNTDRYAAKGTKEFIVFNPNQIKSATDNNGKFDNKKMSFLAKPQKQIRVTPKVTLKKKTALKHPIINAAVQILPMLLQPKNSKIQKIALAGADNDSQFFDVSGQVGKFLQQVERKPFESVVITLDGMQGAGKTTTLYKFMNAFATPGNKCLFISGEEHPASSLAKEKVQKYLSPKAQQNIDSVGEVADLKELYEYVEPYDIIFIDSWQKLQRMVGNIKLDEDLRKKFNGKVFVIIFQQTTTGRTKGGAEVVFDGDIIIKMVKCESFSQNYAYFDKNRYTKIPIENIHYNIATGKIYNPNQPERVQPKKNIDYSFNIN